MKVQIEMVFKNSLINCACVHAWVFMSVYMSVSDSVDKCSCVGTRVDIREQLEQAGSLLPSYDLHMI